MDFAKIRARKPIPENMFALAAEEARDIRANGLAGQRVHVPESVDVAADSKGGAETIKKAGVVAS